MYRRLLAWRLFETDLRDGDQIHPQPRCGEVVLTPWPCCRLRRHHATTSLSRHPRHRQEVLHLRSQDQLQRGVPAGLRSQEVERIEWKSPYSQVMDHGDITRTFQGSTSFLGIRPITVGAEEPLLVAGSRDGFCDPTLQWYTSLQKYLGVEVSVKTKWVFLEAFAN